MSKMIFPNDQFTNTVDKQTFSLSLQTVFSQSLFFISVFPKCIFQNRIFPNFVFPKCIFLKCIFQSAFFQKLSLQSVFGSHIFWALRVYYSRQEKNQCNNGGTGTWSQVDLLTCWRLVDSDFFIIVSDNSIINIKQPEVQALLDPIPGPFGPSFLWNLGFVTHAITSVTVM